MEFAFLVAALAIVGAVALGRFVLEQRRREDLAVAAERLGLDYSPVDAQGCLELPFELLSRGDGRGTENVLWGTWQGIPVRAFDYWCYTESTDSDGSSSRSYSRFSCAVTEIAAACSPLRIHREGLLSRLADAVGFDDLAFESDEFNRAFDVRSRDRRFATALVDARMMHWLLATRPEFGFETCGVWLLCFGPRRKPSELIPLLGTLRQFREHVPRVVSELYPLDPGFVARPDTG